MVVARSGPRLLVKVRGAVAATHMTVAGTEVPIQPLFESIGGANGGLGAAPTGRWYVLDAPPGAVEANAWDLCHGLLGGGLGVGAGAIELAEPDFEQGWSTGREGELALAMAAPCDQADPQDEDFPAGPEPFWFKDDKHSGLEAALAKLGDPGADRVRIAHLDTGYDPRHATLPERIEHDLERNFVDRDRPDDAADGEESGPLTNLGHGTGTLGILAGKGVDGGAPIGGAPFASVVPIRVANGVVLFYTSTIARAFDYVHGLCAAPSTRVDVVTMSMGGLASQAWAEAVNALYEAGVLVVTAAGNNFGNLPTRHIVYPARFNRVVAACGVMADHSPYADLGLRRMAGNYGPPSKMGTAIAAFTPNVPWARLGCARIVDLDGGGTSSATPQIAAAAAIWLQAHRTALAAYPEAWMRVEAVREALFGSAERRDDAAAERLGRGELRARRALDRAPAAAGKLRKEAPDSASFALLRTLTGLGLEDTPAPRRRMLELEALQLSQSAEIEALLGDPEKPATSLSVAERQRVLDALAAQPAASQALRMALGATSPRTVRPTAPPVASSNALQKLHLELATSPRPPRPVRRRLRVYAYDPSLEARLETLGINQATLDVRWEDDLQPGPVGEYVEVIDVDPASRCCYAPVDLNHPHLLVQDGLSPSESNPQFHQQMAYAVAMRTIEHFENALGRTALWAPRRVKVDKGYREDYVQRLRIYPHALRTANAYYSPEKRALLLGYFFAPEKEVGDVLPGGVVFSAVSHDIIAHETSHALLDGLHSRFREPTNPDVLAFHEAFADIVALFQHFTIPEAVRHQIAQTRADLGQRNLMAELAVQFGQATGRYGALRDAIGEIKDGQWVPKAPSRDDYAKATEAHERGAVLVAAVFDAFLQLYRDRTEDLVRLATGGTGVLPEGQLPTILVDRLAQEAAKVAAQVLRICIRALDYCPPVDITFGEYLRAIITADRDLVPDDRRAYRVAFIAGFRERGIYPAGVRHLSVESLAWEPPPLPLENIGAVLAEMSLSWDLTADRRTAFTSSRRNACLMWKWLTDPDQVPDEQLEALGLQRAPGEVTIGKETGRLGGIEVHSVRPARRTGLDGFARSDLVVEITQTFRAPSGVRLRGGCTLLVDLEQQEVRYFLRKRVNNAERLERQQAFALAAVDPVRGNYFDGGGAGGEPFAMLHRQG